MNSRLLSSTFALSALLSFAPAGLAQAPSPGADPAALAPAAPAPELETPAAPATPAAPVITLHGGDLVALAPVSRGQDTLSVDFPEEDIRTVLRNVADLFELNVVIPDALQGGTSIKLRDVTWRQIYQVVLSPVGYTYIEDGNIIKIVSQESLLQEPTSTEVFILNYARASDIMGTITSLVDSAAGGRIVVDARSNALVITERPSRMNRIRPIIEQLDKPTDQVMIETKFIEVNNRDIKNLGVNWASLNGLQLGAAQLGQSFTRDRGRDQTSGFDSSNGNSSSTTSGTNASTTGTLTNGVSSTNGTLTSTSSNLSTSTLGTSSATTGGTSSAFNLLNNLTNTNNTARAATAVFSASDFNVVVSALQTLTNTRIVSNPTVVTLNNTESFINVGEEYPIPEYTYNQERGAFEVSGFEYKPIGIILKVTPQVNAAGFIRLSVEPEVSQRNGETTFGGASGASIPIIATRKARTQVSLRDGYTMGIGGLLRTQQTNGGTKVPVLGDVPGLGKLFRSKSRQGDNTNLLIFITARTLNAEGAPVEAIFDPRQIREMNLRTDDLPGYRESTSPLLPAVSATPPAAPEAQPDAAASATRSNRARR